jgi:hypothetical protein
MAAISAYAEAQMLNWLLGGAASTQPATRAVAISLGAPTSVSASEVSAGSGYARTNMAFNSVSAGGIAINASAATFGPFSSAQSLSGLVIFDTVLSNNSGNMLCYGTLATARTVCVGDSLVIASGALTVSLA